MNQFTKQQIEWASQHDWFVREISGGQIIVRESYRHHGFIYPGSFAQLRVWAGY